MCVRMCVCLHACISMHTYTGVSTIVYVCLYCPARSWLFLATLGLQVCMSMSGFFSGHWRSKLQSSRLFTSHLWCTFLGKTMIFNLSFSYLLTSHLSRSVLLPLVCLLLIRYASSHNFPSFFKSWVFCRSFFSPYNFFHSPGSFLVSWHLPIHIHLYTN